MLRRVIEIVGAIFITIIITEACCSQLGCSSMRDAAPNWWSVVMNIYAQAGLTVMT